MKGLKKYRKIKSTDITLTSHFAKNQRNKSSDFKTQPYFSDKKINLLQSTENISLFVRLI